MMRTRRRLKDAEYKLELAKGALFDLMPHGGSERSVYWHVLVRIAGEEWIHEQYRQRAEIERKLRERRGQL